MAKAGRWICSGLQILLVGGLLLSMTACKPEEASSSTPSQGGEGSTAATPVELPELPENKILVTNPGEGDFLIAQDGEAMATIVIPESPSDKVQAAAADLQTYLKEITGGATVKIGFDNVDRSEGNYILVGPTKQTAALGIEQPTGYPDNERVILKREGNYVVLLGNDDGVFRGTEMAVTMFLENLGCGWFGTEDLWEVVPNYPTLAVGEMDINHTPQFSSRGTRIDSHHNNLDLRWYQVSKETMTGHGLPNMIPIHEYYESHPEWFALVDGSRDPSTQDWWQYDYSNKELAAEVAKKMIAYFDSNPYMMSYPVTSNDGWEESWCECEDCKALGNPTDQLLYFANNVAEIVSEKYPDRTLSILSYHNNYFPPENVKAHPNVEIMFCREASMTTPLDLNKAVLGKNSITHNTYTQSWLDNFKEYIQKAEPQHISIWEWYCIAVENPAWETVPWVQGNVATRNQALWKQNGVEYVFYDQGPLAGYRETEKSFPLRWPLWYVASKGMWDGSLTGEQILYDACIKLYGSAAGEMFGYYKALADSSEMCEAESICWIPCMPSEMYTYERIEVINAAIEAAKAKLDSVTDEQKQRMENQFELWNKALLIIDYN